MSKLVQAARQYLGVPWRHCGRSKVGLDCAGLAVVAYADCGITIPDRRRYGREPLANMIAEAGVEAFGAPVWSGDKGACTRSILQAGDVILMAPIGRPRHVAIVADDLLHGLSIIHADNAPGVMQVLEQGLIDFFVLQIVSVFRRPIE